MSLTEKQDDKSYSILRKANVGTLVEIGENKVYGLIGGGYASDGSSIEAVRTSDYWYNYIRKIELYIRYEYQSLKKQMLPYDALSMEKKLEIKLLTFAEDGLIILEKQRCIILKINPGNGNINIYKLSSLEDGFSSPKTIVEN